MYYSFMQYSIVIPTVPRHHRYIPKLITFLDSNWNEMEEIIIISSSTDAKSEKKLRSSLDSLNLITSLRLVFNPKKQSAGDNRNTGWNISISDFIMFLDADDWYSKKRDLILSNVIRQKNADLILHSYWKFKPKFFLNFDSFFNRQDWIETQKLKESTWNGKLRTPDFEFGINGDTNVIAIDKKGKSLPVQHGHLTIRRSLDIRFPSRYGEDGLLIRDALERDLKVIFIPNKLSIYNQITFHFMLRSIYRFVKRFLIFR